MPTESPPTAEPSPFYYRYIDLQQQFKNVVLQATRAPTEAYCTSRGLSALADALRTLAYWGTVQLTHDNGVHVTATVIPTLEG